jgi:uncharacterized protein with NRDE domain
MSADRTRAARGLETRTYRVGPERSVAYGPAASGRDEWALRFTAESGERVTVRLDEESMYALWTEVHDAPWPRDGTERGDLAREVVARAERADAETLRTVLDLLGGDRA